MPHEGHLSPKEQAQIEQVVVDHVLAQKSWARDEFRLEHTGLSSDEECAIVAVVHRDDEENPVPGAGKSVELHVDRAKQQVVLELGYQ